MASMPVPHHPVSTTATDSADPRERARDARRQAILDAAELVFAERGFGGATMAEIASRAGYSAGNLYNVFDNKEGLFAEVLTARAVQLLDELRGALVGEQPLGATLDRYIDTTLGLAQKHRSLFLIITQTNLDFDWHVAGTEGDKVRDAFLDDLEGVFARAIERGELAPATPRTYCCVVQGAINTHLARWARLNGSDEELLAPAEELRTILKRALGLLH